MAVLIQRIIDNRANLEPPMYIDPIFSNNSWEQIAYASEKGKIPDTWKIGDEINLTLSGDYNMTITLQIWDFNHFDKSDGSGKAGLCLGTKDVYINDEMISKYGNNGSKGYENTLMRLGTIRRVHDSMPSELQNIIKGVDIEYNVGSSSTIKTLSSEKVFIPTSDEVGKVSSSRTFGGYIISIFNDGSYLIKNDTTTGEPTSWWVRSCGLLRFVDNIQTYVYGIITNDGSIDYPSASNALNAYGVVFCFNI